MNIWNENIIYSTKKDEYSFLGLPNLIWSFIIVSELLKEGDNMGMESAYKNKTLGLNDVDLAEITAFLNRKKGEVFWALERQEGLSNKELAAVVDTTPTSLSNILLKFENFSYSLIEGKSRGRKRCYYLTGLAREYVCLLKEMGKDDEKKNSIYQQEEWLLRQRFKDALEQLKIRYEEQWEAVIEDILVRRIFCLEDVGEAEDKILVNEIIFVMETALENEYDGSVDFCMKVLSPSVILSKRLEEYLQYFYVFTPFYKKFQQEKEGNAVGRIFRMMILDGETKQCEQEILRLGLEKEQGHQLGVAIQQIKKYCHERKEELVYEKLQQLMPGRSQLNIFLASWICYCNGQNK